MSSSNAVESRILKVAESLLFCSTLTRDGKLKSDNDADLSLGYCASSTEEKRRHLRWPGLIRLQNPEGAQIAVSL